MINEKRNFKYEKKVRQSVALATIFNLILAVLAFSFMINIESEIVTGSDYRQVVVDDSDVPADVIEKLGIDDSLDSVWVWSSFTNGWQRQPAGEMRGEKWGGSIVAYHPGGEDELPETPLETRTQEDDQDTIPAEAPEVPERDPADDQEVSMSQIATGTSAWKGAQQITEGTELDQLEEGTTFSKGTFQVGEDEVELGWGEEAKITEDGLKHMDKDGEITEYKGEVVAGEGGVAGETGEASSFLSGVLGAGGGSFWDGALSGVQWAAVAYVGGQMLGSMLGLERSQRDAVSNAMAAGFGVGRFLDVYGPKMGEHFGMEWLGHSAVPWVGGALIGYAVLEYFWSEEEQELKSFECLPWEAPLGGEDCEICNEDIYPCTEYRCKSLGQACELINEGTEEQKCIWKDPDDVSAPGIDVLEDALREDYEYVNVKPIPPKASTPGKAEILYEEGCVKPFDRLKFGIQTSEPSQCKISYERTEGENKYDEMSYYFGESNLYKYNHTQELKLPGPGDISAEAPEIKPKGNHSLYVRCRDANGNINEGSFVFNFCVQEGPDVTPPTIEGTSINNGVPVQYGVNRTFLEVYVNKPATCRWSRIDQDYDAMENEMDCDTNIPQMDHQLNYECRTNLTGLQDGEENKFFFRCKNQPHIDEADRVANREGYEFTLMGSRPLNIDEAGPSETVESYTSPTDVTLSVTTANGVDNGKATCTYSETGDEGNWIEMFNTGDDAERVGDKRKHTQRLDKTSGEHTYYFQCFDEGGNADYEDVTFEVDVQDDPPQTVRVYQEEGRLKMVTDKDAVCSYNNDIDIGCDFDIDEGQSMPYSNTTEHFADWRNENYYIKCRDKVGREPLPDECTIIVRPQDGY